MITIPIVLGTARRLGLRKSEPDPCAVRCVLVPPAMPSMTFDDYLHQVRQVVKAFAHAALKPPNWS